MTRSPAGAGNTNARLAVLAVAAFIYVTSEVFPVGLLPEMADGLHVSEADIGLVLAIYAGVVALTAIPLVVLTARFPRRGLVVFTVAALVVSAIGTSLAPNYPVLLVARLVGALTHGVFWSILAPVAAQLAPPGRAGRATATVFLGNSMALVFGSPAATALGSWLGWRVAAGVLAGAAAVAAVALFVVLPPLPGASGHRVEDEPATLSSTLRNRGLQVVCAITLVVVIGHFAAYTYVSLYIQQWLDWTGTPLSLVLLGYGAAGLIGIALVGRITDARPRRAALAVTVLLVIAMAAIASTRGALPILTLLAVLLWGGTFTALPVSLQSAVLRVAPAGADVASSIYVVAFQIGIGSGAVIGGRFVDAGWLPATAIFAAVCAAIAAVMMARTSTAFPSRAGRNSQPVSLPG